MRARVTERNAFDAATAVDAARPRRKTITAIRRYPVLSVIIAMMIVVFISGMATGFDLAVRLNYIFAILIVASWIWSRFGAANIVAKVIRARGPFHVGDTLSETITIRNSSRAPKAWIEIEDNTDIPDVSFRDIASLGIIVPFKSIEMNATLKRRGEYELGPLVLRTADPFALFPREIVFEGEDVILIYPKIESIPNFAAANIHMTGESSRRQRVNVLSTDVSSVREYADGDPVGRIHWLTTARTGNLMVKQFDQGSAGDLWVIFDQHSEAQAGEGSESTDEYGATIAASTVERYAGSFMPVGYAAHGSLNLVVAPEQSALHRDSIMRHIAASRPVGQVPIIDLLASIDRDLYINTTLVVVTAAPDGGWVRALASLQGRGLRVICVAMDRESFGGDASSDAHSSLLAQGIITYRVQKGDDISQALANPMRIDAHYNPSHGSIAESAQETDHGDSTMFKRALYSQRSEANG